jgi:hypothetical protein
MAGIGAISYLLITRGCNDLSKLSINLLSSLISTDWTVQLTRILI